MTTTTTAVKCSFEQDVSMNREYAVEIYSCSDVATHLVWIPRVDSYDPPWGTVLATCEYHLNLDHPAYALPVEAQTVAIANLPMTCAACHEPVWAKHAEDHSVITADDECEWCHGLAASRAASGVDIPTATEHARCSCPEYARYLRAMGE